MARSGLRSATQTLTRAARGLSLEAEAGNNR